MIVDKQGRIFEDRRKNSTERKEKERRKADNVIKKQSKAKTKSKTI